MNLIDIKSYSLAEIEALVSEWGEPPYRASQLFGWLHKKQATSFDQMSDLSKSFRAKLASTCVLPQWEIITRLREANEGTVKYLFRLADGNKVESVYMPSEEGRKTLCISTQVGCKFNCRMCMTGAMGFVRDLTTAEILEQIDQVTADQDALLSNLVFMGMGEPLDNFAEVARALTILSDTSGRAFSLRRVTLSTIGLVDKVKILFDMGLFPNITISLNATTDKQRNWLMPVNKKYPLSTITKAIQELPLPPRRRITIAYVLIKDFNDSELDAENLVKLLPRKKVKINLIPFNQHAKLEFHPPSDDIIAVFQQNLIAAGFSTFLRQSRGQNIKAACGQLAAGEEDLNDQ